MNWELAEMAYLNTNKDSIPSNIREWLKFIEQVEFANKFVEDGYPIEVSGIHENYTKEEAVELLCLGYGYKKSVYEFMRDASREERELWPKELDLTNTAKVWLHFQMAYYDWHSEIFGVDIVTVQPPLYCVDTAYFTPGQNAPKKAIKLCIAKGGKVDLSNCTVNDIVTHIDTTELIVGEVKYISCEKSKIKSIKSKNRIKTINGNNSSIESFKDLSGCNTLALENTQITSFDGFLDLDCRTAWIPKIEVVPEEIAAAYKISNITIQVDGTPINTMKLQRNNVYSTY